MASQVDLGFRDVQKAPGLAVGTDARLVGTQYIVGRCGHFGSDPGRRAQGRERTDEGWHRARHAVGRRDSTESRRLCPPYFHTRCKGIPRAATPGFSSSDLLARSISLASRGRPALLPAPPPQPMFPDTPFLTPTYDPWVVGASIALAILASYVALDLAKRVRTPDRAVVFGWWGGGSIALGTGIWAMHFVGMLAFQLPITVGYDKRDHVRFLARRRRGFRHRALGRRQRTTERKAPVLRRTGDGMRHLRHALHRHARHGDDAGHRLESRTRRAVGTHRGGRIGGRVADLLLVA